MNPHWLKLAASAAWRLGKRWKKRRGWRKFDMIWDEKVVRGHKYYRAERPDTGEKSQWRETRQKCLADLYRSQKARGKS